jgi:hypothetical protein
MNCPNCNSLNINQRADIVQYDVNDRPVAIVVPVMTCKDCAEKWTDDRAEDALWRASH